MMIAMRPLPRGRGCRGRRLPPIPCARNVFATATYDKAVFKRNFYAHTTPFTYVINVYDLRTGVPASKHDRVVRRRF